MQAELSTIERTSTWEIVDAPPNIKPIGCKWIYKIKFHVDESVERFKALLVVQGYNQIEGINYFDNYFPIAKMTTIRMNIALKTINTWFIHQLDVNNAFLHEDLHEDVYLTFPQGITSSKPNHECKLIK